MKEEVKRWWSKAKDDLEKAIILHKNRKYDGAVFFCQQSVEKGLKAVLIKKTGKFPKIHDLIRLARLTNSKVRILELCAMINPAYTTSRYPDSIKKYSKEECKKVIGYTREVLEWIKENLN